MSSGDAETPPARRIAWLDAARGLAVAAVVLLHVGILLKVYSPASEAFAVWGHLNSIGGAVRIPTLLFIAGFLTGPTMKHGWRDVRNRRRVRSTYYLYVVWLIISTPLSALTPAVLDWGAEGPRDLAVLLVLPGSYLWFVYAIAAWTALLTTVRRLPDGLVLGGCAAISVAALQAIERYPSLASDTMIGPVVASGTFLALGSVVRIRFGDFAHRVRPAHAAIGLGALIGLGVWSATGVPAQARGLDYVLVGLAGVAAALTITIVVTPHTPAAVQHVLSVVGRRTLPVYVLHVPLAVAVFSIDPVAAWLTRPGWAVVAPAVVTLAVIVASLLTWRLLVAARCRWLFELPRSTRNDARPGPPAT